MRVLSKHTCFSEEMTPAQQPFCESPELICLSIFALHATWFVIRDPSVTEDERRAASLEVALDLVTR